MSAPPANFSNQLLIALPALDDPHFARGVALICQHDGDGAMGVLVNRASEYTLGEVLAQMSLETQDPLVRDQIVLNGGPVHPERGFVLHDGAREWDSTLAIAENLALTTSRDILEAIAVGEGPGVALFDAALASGRGVIVAAPHHGNWELLNRWLAMKTPLAILYAPPESATVS